MVLGFRHFVIYPVCNNVRDYITFNDSEFWAGVARRDLEFLLQFLNSKRTIGATFIGGRHYFTSKGVVPIVENLELCDSAGSDSGDSINEGNKLYLEIDREWGKQVQENLGDDFNDRMSNFINSRGLATNWGAHLHIVAEVRSNSRGWRNWIIDGFKELLKHDPPGGKPRPMEYGIDNDPCSCCDCVESYLHKIPR